MPTWLIQPVTVEAQSIIELFELLDRAGISYHKVYPLKGVIYNEDKTVFEPVEGEQYFVCGSYPLTRYAHKLMPGSVWSLEEYSMENFMEIFGAQNFVNFDAKKIHSSLIDWNEREEYFVRPIDDTKSFNGGIYNRNTLKYEGDVIVAPLKDIAKEHRFFVIDGQIVTGSVYKVGGQFSPNYAVDEGALEFAKEMSAKFNNPGFVIDVATINQEYKIMELNCLNASGFYYINLYKLINAVEEVYENKMSSTLKIFTK